MIVVMKNVISIVALIGMFAMTGVIATKDEITQEEETMLAYVDPMPMANGGLGCITDSECEGVE